MLGLYLPTLETTNPQESTLAHTAQALQRRRFVIIEEQTKIYTFLQRIADYQRSKGARISEVDLSQIQHRTFRPSVPIEYPYSFWCNGDSYLVLGQPISVLRTMPDDIIQHVYKDSPFHSSFAPLQVWNWNDQAKQREEELKRIHRRRLLLERRNKNLIPDVQFILDYIRSIRKIHKPFASYITWIAIALLECFRIAGKRETLSNLFWRSIDNYVHHAIPTHI